MGHRDSRPLAHAPSLVRESERRSRAADSVDIRTVIVGVYLLGRGTTLGHSLVVESPELVPGDFGLSHEERRDLDLLLRALVIFVERLLVGTAHRELASRDGYHLDRGGGARNSLSEVLKGGDGRFGLVNGTLHGLEHLAFQTFMFVARHIMAHVEMAADAVQSELFGVLLVVEMGGDAVVGDTFGEEVDMTSLARRVINNLTGVLKLPLGLPVNLLRVLCHLRPKILDTDLGLGHVILQETVLFGRKVASGAVSHRSAVAQVVGGFLPVQVSLLVSMAAHAIFIGCGLVHRGVKSRDKQRPYNEAHQTYDPVFAFAFRHREL